MQQLAIIIPYYKIKYFKETLESLEQQSCKKFTLYIGNDASPNDPKSLIDDVLKTTKYTYFSYTENLGGKDLVAQWERVISETDNENWLQILGDDDVLSLKFVEEFYKHLDEIDEVGSNVIKFPQRWIDGNGEPFKEYTQQPKLLSALDNWKEKYIKANRSSLSEHIFRRATYEKIGFKHLPLAWGSDDLAVFEIAGEKPVFFIGEAQVEVRISAENISGSRELYVDKQRLAIAFETDFINQHYKLLPKDYLKDRINQQISFAFHHHISDLRLNLAKYYWYLGEYKKILKLPYTYWKILTKKP